LDKVTSNIDDDTNRVLMAVVREAFKDCIVLMVAHRPEMILGADVVAGLDGGASVEFGVPEELVHCPGSIYNGNSEPNMANNFCTVFVCQPLQPAKLIVVHGT
jgi:ABC-type multidrug transport system fused ATPase/permease subunit